MKVTTKLFAAVVALGLGACGVDDGKNGRAGKDVSESVLDAKIDLALAKSALQDLIDADGGVKYKAYTEGKAPLVKAVEEAKAAALKFFEGDAEKLDAYLAKTKESAELTATLTGDEEADKPTKEKIDALDKEIAELVGEVDRAALDVALQTHADAVAAATAFDEDPANKAFADAERKVAEAEAAVEAAKVAPEKQEEEPAAE